MKKRVVACLLGVATVACGGSHAAAPTPLTPSQAVITATVTPNPVTSIVCSPSCVATSGTTYQFRAVGVLQIQETAGVAATVDSIVSGGLTYSSTDVTQRSGTNRVAAGGVLQFPLAFVYGPTANANAQRTTVFPIVVSVTDDRGNHVSGTVQWVTN